MLKTDKLLGGGAMPVGRLPREQQYKIESWGVTLVPGPYAVLGPGHVRKTREYAGVLQGRGCACAQSQHCARELVPWRRCPRAGAATLIHVTFP